MEFMRKSYMLLRRFLSWWQPYETDSATIDGVIKKRFAESINFIKQKQR